MGKAEPHPVDYPPRASELDKGAAGMVFTVAPNVGQPPVVDDEVVWRGDRRSIRDTGFGSMDRSTESRLATPADFRRSTTIKHNMTVSGVSATVICDDLRRTCAPKNVTFQGIEYGVTVLNCEGKQPETSDALNSRATKGDSRLHISFTSHVGIGSIWHVLVGAEPINFSTLSTVTAVHSVSCGVALHMGRRTTA